MQAQHNFYLIGRAKTKNTLDIGCALIRTSPVFRRLYSAVELPERLCGFTSECSAGTVGKPWRIHFAALLTLASISGYAV
ncbi:MAG: hypothetical protein LBU32_17515 [Clostridiales bacterium]|nr:hypothetical protein [Clostridiales bacterium]